MKPNRLVSSQVEKIVSIEAPQRTVNPVVALRALYQLLEDYGPMWYTQEAHDLAASALRENGFR